MRDALLGLPLPRAGAAGRRKQDYREELDRLFRQAVKRQLVSDVELGAYLSGGMDSGSITAVAAQLFHYLKTFTCGFDLSSASGIELAFDERAKAEAMSARFKTEHYEMVLKAGDMERVLPRLAWHLEEPRVGQSYPNFYAAQLASKFVKVVLSGAGGDELFGGYPWRYYRAVGQPGLRALRRPVLRFWQRLIPNDRASQGVRADLGRRQATSGRATSSATSSSTHDNELDRPEDYINHSLYFEAKTFLHGLLVVEDKLSMAHGLETRVPFLDNDLVDFAMRCPVRLKLNNLAEVARINENEPGDKTGALLPEDQRRQADPARLSWRGHMPSEIAQAEKQGFSRPMRAGSRARASSSSGVTLLARDARIYSNFGPAGCT